MAKLNRATNLMLLAVLGLSAPSAWAQRQSPQGQPAVQPAPQRPFVPTRPIIMTPRSVQPAPATPQVGPQQQPQPQAQPQVQPQNIQPARGPSIQPGSSPGGVGVPTIAPMNIQGQRAPTPFWWGPSAGGAQPGRRTGPIPGAYTPMGRPAVLVQPPAYPEPGTPVRTQNELSYGPLAPPGPNLPEDGLGPIRPITDPNPISAPPPPLRSSASARTTGASASTGTAVTTITARRSGGTWWSIAAAAY